MGSTADLVLANFRWRIEAITPTHQRPGRGFRRVDRQDRYDPSVAPGAARAFVVQWSSEGPEPTTENCSDIAERIANHAISVDVYYPDELGLELQQEIALQDRHDILRAMRATAQYVGYDASHTTTDLGLYRRECTGVQALREFENTLTIRFQFECTIREAE